MALAMLPTSDPFDAPIMDRSAVLSYYRRLIDTGLEEDEAITQTLEAIIDADRAVAFVRAFGRSMIKGMISAREAAKHPSNFPMPIWTYDQGGETSDGGQDFSDTQTIDAATDCDDEDGQARADTHASSAASSSLDIIPQVFPDGLRRRVNPLRILSDPNRKLTGMMAGTWQIDGMRIPMGLLTAEQCFRIAEREKRRGVTHLTNARMFERIGTSLKDGEVVADRWSDDSKLKVLFEISEPALA